MSVPSDIPPIVENLQIICFYVVGIISFIVNSITAVVIARKRDILTREVRVITLLLQFTCLVHNIFYTLLFIPFFYIRAGAGYCVGLICSYVPFQPLSAVFVFLSLSMFAFFGMLIIVRHQILLFDGSFFKLSSPLRYLSYFTLFCTFQILTVFTALTIQSDRDRQIYTLAKMYPQLKWRERRLNWHLFDGYKFPNLLKASTYFIYIFVSFWFAFVFLPFVHIFFIVIRSGRNRSRCKTKRTHLRQAKTVIVQFLVLLLFLAIPLMLGYSSIWRDNIYAETQILMAVGEMLFASSTLANSCVVILRNPVYVTELSSVFRYAFRFARKRVSVSIARIS